MSYIYLASPYSHPLARIREARYCAVRDTTAWMLQRRIWTYSPIVHCHDLARSAGMPLDAGFWQEYNHAMIRTCEMLYVLQLDGWNESIGVAGEMAFAKVFNKPVVMLAPLAQMAVAE